MEWTSGQMCELDGDYIGRADCDKRCEHGMPGRYAMMARGDTFFDCTVCGGPVRWRLRGSELPPVFER